MDFKTLKFKWYSCNKSINYIHKNKRLSPIDTRIRNFIIDVYQYTIIQNYKSNIKNIYEKYINLVNISLNNNREEPSQEILDNFLIRAFYVLDREISSPRSFILVNLYRHYLELKEALIKIRSGTTPQNYGYLSLDEFQFTLDMIKDKHEKISN
jgi:hypothetical protein